jgi:hypothetical protein
VASASATSIACFGGSATVTVSATGGTAPYTGTGSFSVTAGTYTYTVTDANGCTATASVTVTQPTRLLASSSATSIACFGGTSTVTVSATGGTAPYTGTGSFTVTAGTYTYTVTDANGCTASTFVTVTAPASAVTANAGPNASVIYGYPSPLNCTTLIGSATGGTGPYTYLWSTGASTASISVCPSTTTNYTLTVTDSHGCTRTDVVTVCVVDVRCGSNKVSICHIPPGNPSAANTLCVGAPAVSAHLAHGDYLGACGATAPCLEVARVAPSAAASAEAGEEMSIKAYPNPFSYSTTVDFAFTSDEVATLRVFNMNGVEVANLYEGLVYAGQTISADFTAENLSNGIYFARLTTVSGKETNVKLILSK